eukprot:GHVQ01015021.1.p1 GENE.GHVQ01015021.1~~GHVQ01015021.1.p1  ORF type:complete len:186 (+),score=38.80 GHVQ01015021.1:215-772(+)
MATSYEPMWRSSRRPQPLPSVFCPMFASRTLPTVRFQYLLNRHTLSTAASTTTSAIPPAEATSSSTSSQPSSSSPRGSSGSSGSSSSASSATEPQVSNLSSKQPTSTSWTNGSREAAGAGATRSLKGINCGGDKGNVLCRLFDRLRFRNMSPNVAVKIIKAGTFCRTMWPLFVPLGVYKYIREVL